ncbi:MAG: DUF1801 domain-containing protein [Balneolaceae bacterium]|nr:DUF1801 domain-containing protein [Balneolaceae bacterium]
MSSKNKTVPTPTSAESLIRAIDNDVKREDAKRLLKIMGTITREDPVVWGSSIIGFGSYHYTYNSGREGDYFLTGFSPRKNSFSIYIMAGFDHFPELMKKLGKYKTGKSCLYVKQLDDIDESVLKELIQESVNWMRQKYPSS